MQTYQEWAVEQIDGLTETIDTTSPSEWAEKNRYLPSSVTPLPGYYRYDVSPPLKEIVDCMDVSNPVREVNVMKGAQICFTVGVLENVIGYNMAVVKSSPVMMLTADAELAKLRMESYITPMIQQSDLAPLVKSSDEMNFRKHGKTDKKIEWQGGGFLVPFGAKNAAKLRSISIQCLLQDEIDGFPDKVGKDGDPCKLAEARTKAYHQTRKILRGSTPLIKGQSRIDTAFKEGDQRYFEVPCLKCGEYQVLKFSGHNEETGEVWGLTWDMDGNRLVPGSTRYVCRHCGHAHRNSDKTKMFPRGEWVPTAKPKSPVIRSYHLSALYAPAAMYPWEAMVLSWLEAWDVKNNRARDFGRLQEFYNNDLGKVFEIRGDKLRFDLVSAHRRREFRYGEVPNTHAVQHGDGFISLITCAVDVHKENLAVAVYGWSRWGRSYLLDYWRFNGKCEDIFDANTWGELQKVIEDKEYFGDDGKSYRISLTLVDSGYFPDQVINFCSQYAAGVCPIKGRSMPPKNATIREFSPFVTQSGVTAYGITVDLYKDRLSAALRRNWDGVGKQPKLHFNAPLDATDKQLKELTVENKREKIEKTTGKRVGFEWYRPSGARNELWDLFVYNAAALDLVAWDVSVNVMGMDYVNMPGFWDHAESGDGNYWS